MLVVGFLLLAAAALLFACWPLLRRHGSGAELPGDDAATAVYRRRLEEIGGEIDPAFLAEIEPRVIEALGHADLVVFVPIERDIGNQPDGFRYLDGSNRRRVHRPK